MSSFFEAIAVICFGFVVWHFLIVFVNIAIKKARGEDTPNDNEEDDTPSAFYTNYGENASYEVTENGTYRILVKGKPCVWKTFSADDEDMEAYYSNRMSGWTLKRSGFCSGYTEYEGQYIRRLMTHVADNDGKRPSPNEVYAEMVNIPISTMRDKEDITFADKSVAETIVKLINNETTVAKGFKATSMHCLVKIGLDKSVVGLGFEYHSTSSNGESKGTAFVPIDFAHITEIVNEIDEQNQLNERFTSPLVVGSDNFEI